MNWLDSDSVRGLALALVLGLVLLSGAGCLKGGREAAPGVGVGAPPGGSGAAPSPVPNPAPNPSPTAPGGGDSSLEHPQLSQVPQEVQAWVQASLPISAGQSKNTLDKTYILVTAGTKPTGGYTVEIQRVDRVPDRMIAQVAFGEPKPGEAVIQVLSNPYDLVAIPRTDLPVDFVTVGDPEHYIMRVLNTEMRPVVAESFWIKVFAPAPGAEVAGTFTLEGVASVFEGTISYRLRDDRLAVAKEGFTTACMGDWGHFSAQLEVPAGVKAGATIYLELYTVSPKDGAEQDQVAIPLIVKG